MKQTLLIALTLISGTALAQIPTVNLLANYPLNGNANDISGNGLHGTVVGATLTDDRFGTPNSAFNFNGIDQYIEFPASIMVGHSAYTYSLWVKPAENPTNYSFNIFSVGSATSNHDQAVVYQPGTTYHAGSYNSGSMLPFQSKAKSGPIAPNQWTHIAITRDMTTIKLYVNGVETSQIADHATNNQAATYGSTSRAIIGARSNLFSDTFFKGAMGGVRTYSRALSSGEITALFNESITATAPAIAAAKIQVFPNPSNGHFTVTAKAGQSLAGAELKLVNSLGQTVHQEILTQENPVISVTGRLAAGLYYVCLTDAASANFYLTRVVIE